MVASAIFPWVAAFTFLAFLVSWFLARRNDAEPPDVPLALGDADRFPAGTVVRSYREQDRAACIAIYESNVGDFVPPTPDLFCGAIDEHPEGFFVAEIEGEVLACGGITIYPEHQQAVLWMGMVHRASHRRGLGTLVLLSRLACVEDDPTTVTLETTVVSESFYAKFGFRRYTVPEKRYPGEHAHFSMYRVTPLAERQSIRVFLRDSSVRFEFDFDARQPQTPSV